MTLQTVNLTTLILWTLFGVFARWSIMPLADVIFTALTFIVVFILAGVSLTYFIVHRQPIINKDTVLLTTIGIVVSIFIIPLLVFLVDTQIPLRPSLVLAALYFLLLLLPQARPALPFLPSFVSLRHLFASIRHPAILAFILVLLVQVICLHQYVFLPGLDSYTWLLKYEVSLSDHLYDLSAGVNRILFATLVAIIARLSSTPLFSLFKYWFPLLSLLPIIPLWLIARTLSNKYHQFLYLSSLLASPALILDWQTTRHQSIFLLFIYLSLGLLFTAHRWRLPQLFWLTFLAAFVGIVYHPLFLILIVFWLFAALIIHRRFINQHPVITIFLSLIFFAAAHLLKLTSLITNIVARLHNALTNFISFHWNLAFPTAYISEGLPMGWPGLSGVLRFYGYYAGPITLLVLLSLFFTIASSASFRHRLTSIILSPFLLPLTGFFLLLLFLAEILTRFAGIAYLPDRAWLLISLPVIIFLPLLFNQTSHHRLLKIFTVLYTIALIVSISGTFYINHALAYSIPDYELDAARWIKANLPPRSYIFTSSSKNILRYYARSQPLRMDPSLIASDQPAAILSYTHDFSDIVSPHQAYIYYAVTDPRNPFIERPYVSSFTQARDPSSFIALSSHPDLFELVYTQPNFVYLWRIK